MKTTPKTALGVKNFQQPDLVPLECEHDYILSFMSQEQEFAQESDHGAHGLFGCGWFRGGLPGCWQKHLAAIWHHALGLQGCGRPLSIHTLELDVWKGGAGMSTRQIDQFLYRLATAEPFGGNPFTHELVNIIRLKQEGYVYH